MTTDAPIDAIKIEHNTISKELSRFRACDAETRCYFCREWAQFVYKKHFAWNTKQTEGNGANSLGVLKAGRYRLKVSGKTTTNERSMDLFEPFKKMLEDPAAAEAAAAAIRQDSDTLIDGIIKSCRRWIEQPSRVVSLPGVIRPVHFDPYDPVLFDEDGPKDPARLLEPLVSERQHILLPAKGFHLLKNLTGDILLSYKEATCDHIRPEWKSPSDLEMDRDIFNEKMEKARKELMVELEKALDKAWKHLTEFLESLQVLDKERAMLMGKGCQKTIDDFVERQKIQPFDEYWAALGEQYKKQKAAVDIETVDKAFEEYFDQLAVHAQQFLKDFALPRLKAIHELVKKLWVLVISTIEKMADRMLASGEKNEMHLEQCRMLSTSLKDLHPTSDVLVNVETVQQDIEGKVKEYLEDIAKLKRAYKDENQKNVRSRLEKTSGSKTVKKQIKRVANGYASLRQNFEVQVTQKIFPETLFCKFGLIVAEALMQEGEDSETAAIDTVVQRFIEQHEELIEERQYLIDDFEEGVVTGRTELAGVLGRLFMTEIKRIQGEIQARQRQRDLLKSFGVDVDEKDEEGSGKKKKNKKKKKANGTETASASPTPSASTVSEAATTKSTTSKASETAKTTTETTKPPAPKAPPTLVIKNAPTPTKEKDAAKPAPAPSTTTTMTTKSAAASKATATSSKTTTSSKPAEPAKPAVTKKVETPKAKAVETPRQVSMASKIAASSPPVNKEPIEAKPKQSHKEVSPDGWQTIPSKKDNNGTETAAPNKKRAPAKKEEPKGDGWNTVAAAKKEEVKAAADGWDTVASSKKEETKAADGWDTVAASKKEEVKNDGWNTASTEKKEEEGWGSAPTTTTSDGWGPAPVKNESSSEGWNTATSKTNDTASSGRDSVQKSTVDGRNTATSGAAAVDGLNSMPNKQEQATGRGSTSQQPATKKEEAAYDGWGQKKQAADSWRSSPSKQEPTTSDSRTNAEDRGWSTAPAQNNDLGGWRAAPANKANDDGWGPAPSSNSTSGWGEPNTKNQANNNWNKEPAALGGWSESKGTNRNQKAVEVDSWNAQPSKSVDRWENVGKEARGRTSALGNGSWGSTTPTSDRGWGSPIKTTSSVPMDGHDWTANTEKDWNNGAVGGWNAKETQAEEPAEVVNFSLKDLLQQQQQTPPMLQQASLLQQQQPSLMPQSAPAMPPGLNKSETTPSTASLVQIAQDQALSPQKILEMDRDSIVKVIEELQRENIRLLQTLVTTQQEMAIQSTRYTELLQLSRERESQMLQLFEARKQTEMEEARRYILSLEARINTLENQLKSSASQKGGITAGFGNQDLFAGYREEMHQQQRKPYFSRRTTLKCANCGKSGHASADCRLACRYCGSNDHLSDACLSNN